MKKQVISVIMAVSMAILMIIHVHEKHYTSAAIEAFLFIMGLFSSISLLICDSTEEIKKTINAKKQ